MPILIIPTLDRTLVAEGRMQCKLLARARKVRRAVPYKQTRRIMRAVKALQRREALEVDFVDRTFQYPENLMEVLNDVQ